MRHQCHSTCPLHTQIDTFKTYNSCTERHSRMVILYPQNTENIHQINNECKLSHVCYISTKIVLTQWTLAICVRQTFMSRRPKECREILWQIGGIILMHDGVQNCIWIVQHAVHYCKFIWWIELCITQLRRTICDQKFGLKLQFAYVVVVVCIRSHNWSARQQHHHLQSVV